MIGEILYTVDEVSKMVGTNKNYIYALINIFALAEYVSVSFKVRRLASTTSLSTSMYSSSSILARAASIYCLSTSIVEAVLCRIKWHFQSFIPFYIA